MLLYWFRVLLVIRWGAVAGGEVVIGDDCFGADDLCAVWSVGRDDGNVALGENGALAGNIEGDLAAMDDGDLLLGVLVKRIDAARLVDVTGDGGVLAGECAAGDAPIDFFAVEIFPIGAHVDVCLSGLAGRSGVGFSVALGAGIGDRESGIGDRMSTVAGDGAGGHRWQTIGIPKDSGKLSEDLSTPVIVPIAGPHLLSS